MALFKFIANSNPDPVCAEVKCTNCDTMETPVWRFSENRKKVCNACYL